MQMMNFGFGRTYPSVLEGGAWAFFSSKQALGIYLVVVMALVCALVVNIVISLQMVKKHGGFAEEMTGRALQYVEPSGR